MSSNKTIPLSSPPQAADSALEVTHLSKCYTLYAQPQDWLKNTLFNPLRKALCRPPAVYAKEFWALQDVSFQVHKGEIMGILGANGAGKSTLLQLICGTLSPTHGTIHVHGRLAAMLELGAGFNPHFTGRENVLLKGALLGLSRQEMTTRFDAIAAFADIGDFMDYPVSTYSSGMFMRLAFAVCACVQPDILIIDEALAVGDAKFQTKCFRHFEDLIAQGKTILFVSHSTEQVVRHCHRAVFLEHGKLKAIGDAKEMAHLYLNSLFGAQPKKKMPSVAKATPTSPPLTFKDLSLLEKLPHYNPHEYRWGNGLALIETAALHQQDALSSTSFVADKPLQVMMGVRFLETFDPIIFGVTLKTADGITVYGSNSRDFTKGPLHISSNANHTLYVRFELEQLNLLQGDYFLSLGVVHQAADGTIVPLDRRYDVLHLYIHNSPSHHGSGLADLRLNVQVDEAVRP